MMKNNAHSVTKNWPVRKSLYIAIATVSQVMISTQVLANPEGGQVVGGRGSIVQSGLNTTINQQTDRMAIDWQSFNVAADEKVKFIQPGSSSVALNRVLSHTGSEIHGQIEANGHIVLVNPNGVFFGENSRINVGGMIASGLNIDPNDFMNGDFTLTAMEGTEGKVINSGIINAATGGSVTLVGQQVKNEGLISAKLGAVNLAAGKEAVVTFDSSGLVGIKVTKEILQNELGLDAAVINSGEINAEGGRILLTASTSQDIFSQAVNSGDMDKAASVVMHEDGSFTLGAGADVVNAGNLNVSGKANKAGQVVILGENITTSGEIFADAQTNHAGNIELHSTDTTLVTESGMVSAQSASEGKGGKIKILGNKVGLLDHARVNASGEEGGGEILIGGDESGQNNRIRNANFIYLSENSAASANGIIYGDGGKLITFANDTARIYGDLSASGGHCGGNGGFIETSGLRGFEILKTPDVSSSKENAGTWLIDPYDIRIEETDFSNITPSENKFVSTSSGSIIKPSNLLAALNAGTSVIIQTGAGESAGGDESRFGDITLVDNIVFNIDDGQTATLRLEAHNAIIFNKDRYITRSRNGSGTLNIELVGNLDGNKDNGGDIVFSEGSYINTFGGSFSAEGLGVSFLNSDSTAINTAINPFRENELIGGSVTLNMSGAISLGSAIKTGGGSFTVEGSASFTNSESYIDTAGGTVSINSDGHVTLNDKSSEGITLGASNISGNFVLTSDEGIKQVAALVIEGETTLDAGDNAVDLSNAENNFHQIVSASNNSSFKLTDIDDLIVGAITTSGQDNQDAGEIKITAGGSLTTGALTASGGAATTGNVGKKGGVISLGAESNITVNGSIKSNGSNGAESWNGGNWLSSRNGGNGESVSITSENGSVTVSSIDTSGGDGRSSFSSDNDNGGNAGTIEINAGNPGTITLTGNLSAQGGGRERGANGSGANIDLGGNIKLAGNIAIHAGVKENVEDGGTRGNLHVTGTIESETSASSLDLTITAKDITFNDNVGREGDLESALGTFTLHATGAIVAKSAGAEPVFKNINVSSLNGSAKTNFHVGNINTAATAADTAGGSITIAANNIRVGAISSSGLGTENGGTITISASGEGASIELAGDINSQAGIGSEQDQGSVSLTLLSAGSIDLNHTVFFTSTVGITGSGETDTLKGFDIDSTWSIDKKNGGNINNNVFFDHIKRLEGGNGNDTFTFTFAGENNAGSVTSINGGGGEENKLVGRDTESTWVIGENNSGSVSDSSSTYVTIFENINNLQGGSRADTFNVGAVFNGDLSGGDDADIFNIEAVVVGDLSGDNGEDIFNIDAFVDGALLGGGGNDQFIFLPSGSAVSVDGEGDSDTLTGRDAENTWTISADNAGSLKKTGSDTNYVREFAGIETLQGGGDVDTFNITASFSGSLLGGSDEDIFNLGANVTGNVDGQDDNDIFNIGASIDGLIYGNTGNDKFTITAASISASLDGGGDDGDSLTTSVNSDINAWTISGDDTGKLVNGGTVNFQGMNTLNGGSGIDTFVLSEGASFSGTINGGSGSGVNQLTNSNNNIIWSLTGEHQGNLKNTSSDTIASFHNIQTITGSGSDTLIGRNQANDWQITATNSGHVQLQDTPADRMEFSGMKNLTGNSNNDSFTFGIAGIVTGNLDGGQGYDTIVARDTNNSWVIDGIDPSQLIDNDHLPLPQTYANFVGIESLIGGDAADIFSFVNNGTITHADGGGGIDSISYAGIDDVVVTLGGTAINGVHGIEQFIGNSSSSTLKASNTNGTNTWTIFNFDPDGTTDGINDGEVALADGSVIKFIDFNNLEGGSGEDIFKFDVENSGSITGNISGGGGSSTLKGRDANNTWNIIDPATNTLVDTDGDTVYVSSFTNIQTLQGGAYDDIFNIKASVKTLLGGDGNDQFIFSSENNAGRAENIDGGDGDNLLIGRNAESTWNLTAAKNSLRVTNGALYVDSFKNIQTLQGGSEADIYQIGDGFAEGNIRAGAGDDIFYVKGVVNSLSGEAGNDSFIFDGPNNKGSVTSIDGGGDDEDTLIGRNKDNVWSLTSTGNSLGETVDAPYVASFKDIQILQGGSEVDTFEINEIFTGNIRGGFGNDVFNINAESNALFGEAGDDRFYFSSENNKGTAASIDGGDNNDSIFGRHAATIWVLDEAGSTLSAGGSEYVSALTAIDVLQGGDAIDTFIINSAFNRILGGGQNDIFNINASVNTLLGEDGNDQFIFSSVGNAGRAENIDGGDGNDLLIGRNANSTWNLNDQNSVRVTDGAVYVDAFTNIQILQGGNAVDTFNINHAYTGSIYGGAGKDIFEIDAAVNELFGEAGDDQFTFAVGGSASLVNGGAGTNTLIGRNAANIWQLTGANEGSLEQVNQSVPYITSFVGIHHLTGGSGTDTLIAHNQHNQWNIDGSNKGSVGDAATPSGTHIAFNEMENISGGTLEDNFIFFANGDITGLIDGGTHGTESVTDLLDLSLLNDSVEVELFESTSDRLHVINMETITAPSASAANNHLYGASDKPYAWTINGTNAGSVAVSGSSTSESIVNFENFGRLRGGTNDDTFEVVTGGNITGTIHGGDGAGIDSVDYSGTKAHVTIALGGDGSLGVTGIDGIERVIGNNDGTSENEYYSLIRIVGGDNTWTIDGINDGQIAINGSTKPIFFKNFNILNGGSGDDKFNLSGGGQFIGYINGGGGNNSFNATASSVDQAVYINSSAIDLDGVAYVAGATRLFGFDTITANADTRSTLISNEKVNTWNIQLNGENLLSVDGNNISFDGFSKLVGGADADSFYIHSLDNIPAVIDGGTGAPDYVYFTPLNPAVGVTIGVGDVPANTDLNIFRIEHLAGHDNDTNTLISNGTSDSWVINGSNQGILNSDLNFSGFANLTGGDGDDKFSIEGKDAALSGTMNGGAGDDSLSFTGRAATLELFAATLTDDHFNAVNFEIINADTANESFSNTLIAGNTKNDWIIDSLNAGTVNNGTLTTTFKGFKNLTGGRGIDEFIFKGVGSLGGYIDGGSQPDNGVDTVDLSALNKADVFLGNTTYRNIEKIIGNGNGILTSSETSIWNLLGQNSGDVNGILFEGFSSLVGGEGNDQFNLTQGSLSGSVYGGDGNDTFTISGAAISDSVYGGNGDDTFEVSGATITGSLFGEAGNDLFIATITAGNKGQVRFEGGDGNNRLEAGGGNADYNVQHSFTGTSGGLLRYTDEQNNVYNLSYSGVNDIFDSVTADLLTVTTTAAADTLTLRDGAYSLNQTTHVNYNNKNNLTIAASSADEVIVSGAVNIPELLTIQDARVSAVDNNSVITADGLRLDGTAEVGTSTNRVNVSINDLYVRSANGAIYLQEQSGLNIGEFSTSATVDLSLDGDLTSSVALSSSQDINIKTSNGNIVLDKENALSGGLTLAAANSINLRNLTATNFKNVSARDLTVNSTGIINGGGLIQVDGLASLVSGGNINLANQNHNFNFLQIGSAANVSINNSDSLRLTGVTASGALNINAQGINVNGPINTASVMLNAGQGDAVLSGIVAVDGIANVVGRNIMVDGDLLAANIQLDGSQGQVLINGRLNTDSKESITVTANQVVQNGLISAGTGVTVQAAASLTQNADITAVTDVSLSAGGDLLMNAGHITQGRQVNYSAGGIMVLADITATKGITISAAGNVNQNGNIVSSSGDIAIDSGRYNMSAGTALIADAGSVLLTSNGDLTTREISAATDVSLAASGNAQILGQATTTNGAISIRGGGVTLANNVIGNAGIEVVSVNGDIQQQAQLNSAQGDIRVVANGNITMDSNSSTLSTNGNIDYSGASLGITSFDALKTVTLGATRGAVTDLNGNDNNITAHRLVIDAATGIGSNDIIETLVDELSVSNNVGDIRLQNNKAVTVDRLRSNGNIVFNNLVGSVTLDNSEGTLFSRSETDARLAGGTMNANYDIGALTINVAAGDLIATGVADLQNPDIVARNAALIAPLGSIGEFGRPLVVYVKDSLFIAGFNSWNPFWAFGVPPTTVDNASTIQGNLSDLLASGNETLVVVEALNEVDPAIFTNVRNYFYDDVSILLPTDQLYYGE